MEEDILEKVALALPMVINIMSSQAILHEAVAMSEHSYDDEEMNILIGCNAFADRQEESKAKITNYISDIVPKYTDEQFRRHFRLQKSTVEFLMQLIGPELDGSQTVHPGRSRSTGYVNLLLPIWVLSNQESFRGICDRFGVGDGHGYRIFQRFCTVLVNRLHDFITWPTGSDFDSNLLGFEKLRANAFPGVVGCVDGSYIPIRGRANENDSYCTRKKFRAVILQAICDHKKRFIDIFAGWPGSCHDARVWRNSPIYENIKQNTNSFLPSNTHILGDSAYPLDNMKTHLAYLNHASVE